VSSSNTRILFSIPSAVIFAAGLASTKTSSLGVIAAFSPSRIAPRTAHEFTPISQLSSRTMTSSSLGQAANNEGDGSATTAATIPDPLVHAGLPSPLILGSGSFTRKLILKEMGVKYELVVRSIDEKGIGDRNGDPAVLVSTLAKAKGDYLVKCLSNDSDDDALSTLEGTKATDGDFGGWVVLTADQVVTHDESILEKPESIEEAREFVRRYAESAPQTVGACVLTHIPSGIQVSGVDSAQINFFPTVADGDLVGKLVEDDAPVLSCAGGLMVEHPLVQAHISGIDGTEDSVMGLSKDLVLRLLDEMKEKLKNKV
jgi:septum formation protein